jgi:4-diphosphocytidyl-2-C-methyl-D-erythritol kinase
MVVFPNCKINIGLNILGKREDGYHNLQTIFFPAAVNDVLEIIEYDGEEDVQFSSSGIHVPGKAENNLCIKAYHLLKKDFPNLPHVQMHLHKSIPMGAGLGGGSADAAFALQLLNRKFSLDLSKKQLLENALQLGSDCPFFIINKPCFATGRGEILEPVELNLSAYKIFIINPGIHISTSLAFSQITVSENKEDLQQLIAKPITNWKETIFNDFEKEVFEIYPEIGAIKNELYNQGALFASMSGSGSTLYGIFKKDAVTKMNFPAHYFQRWV